MTMTIVVTCNSPERFRGFLASCMCEIAPGVYTGPRMAASVRERVWSVLVDWFRPAAEHAILMTWPEPNLPGGQAVRVLGIPRTDLCDHHGVFLTKREIGEAEIAELERASRQDLGTPPHAS